MWLHPWCEGRRANRGRIFEKNHLLDATEIFRKLNVHKKVRLKQPSTMLGAMC